MKIETLIRIIVPILIYGFAIRLMQQQFWISIIIAMLILIGNEVQMGGRSAEITDSEVKHEN